MLKTAPRMPTFNDTFLKACRREPVDHVPVWYMRQAGRYQAEYRAIKETRSLMAIVRDPALCATVTRLPVDHLGVDAAILFSDIMTPLTAMGVKADIRDGVGPVIENPVRAASDIDHLHVPDFAAALPYVVETVQLLRTQLAVPLIGFCGAPFTLACYLVEGGPSKHYARVRAFMYGEPLAWHRLMDLLTGAMVAYLRVQAEAGAQALQVFDSWVGQLDHADYERYVLPHMRRLFVELRRVTRVPVIHFGVGTGHLLELLHAAGGDVIGLDWRTELPQARRRLGTDVALQGNLDSALLLAPWDVLETRARAILAAAPPNGFVFNLGHGVLPQTQPETLRRLTEFVHAWRP